jgi:hypothetical protein
MIDMLTPPPIIEALPGRSNMLDVLEAPSFLKKIFKNFFRIFALKLSKFYDSNVKI